MTNEALQQRLSGRAFNMHTSEGQIRLQFKADGYAFLNASNGYKDSGRWRLEGSRMCLEWRKSPSGCTDARLKGESIYIKRFANGEISALVPE
jgi:hypothetical protein